MNYVRGVSWSLQVHTDRNWVLGNQPRSTSQFLGQLLRRHRARLGLTRSLVYQSHKLISVKCVQGSGLSKHFWGYVLVHVVLNLIQDVLSALWRLTLEKADQILQNSENCVVSSWVCNWVVNLLWVRNVLQALRWEGLEEQGVNTFNLKHVPCCNLPLIRSNLGFNLHVVLKVIRIYFYVVFTFLGELWFRWHLLTQNCHVQHEQSFSFLHLFFERLNFVSALNHLLNKLP